MPSLAGVALQSYQVASCLKSAAVPRTFGTLAIGILTSTLLYVAYAAVTCAFGAAVHRNALVGETSRGYYGAAAQGQRTKRFLLAIVAVYVVFLVLPQLDNLVI